MNIEEIKSEFSDAAALIYKTRELPPKYQLTNSHILLDHLRAD